MAAKDELGRDGEARAARHLKSCGYTVLDRNWRGADGEIDLVVASADELVVVEVKTRRTPAFGHPLEAIDTRKRRRLWRLALAWIAAHPSEARGRTVRVDAIGLTGADPRHAQLEHVRDVS